MKDIFAHLHVHSDFTLAKGASKIKSIVAAAKAANIPAIAIVDEGNMYGAMEFSMAAVGKGIQPIIGVKLWFDNGLNTKGSIILLAQNEKGYENICHILAQSHRPREGNDGGMAIIPVEVISGNTEGIIALTGGVDGCIRTLLENNRNDDAEQLLNWLRFEFCDRIYLEITRFGDETEKDVEI
ncbi:MAG: PHP domain-containing protein, partial [Pseudomonas aeruginosa]